jgi:hypothetical protein
VVDNATSLPLPGASVVLLNSDPVKGTSTDEKGNFRFDEVPVGRQSLKVTFIGYQDKFVNDISVTTGKELVLTVRMEESTVSMSEVIIRADSRKDLPINEMALISARSFTIEETERYAGSVGDPARMASSFAGVAAMSDQQNEIVIRGNSPMGLQWRLDGMDIPNPNHFGAVGTTGGGISMINNNTLSNSDFYTGAFPAEFGNALSGVFDLRMRNGNNERYEYTLQAGFNGLEAGAEGPISRSKGSSFLVNYRYSALKLASALIGTEALTVSAVPYYHDLSVKINFPSKKFGRFSITGLGGLSGINENDSERDTSEWSGGYRGTDYHFGTRMGTLIASHLYYFNTKTWLDSYVSLSGVNSFVNQDTLTTSNMDPSPQSRQDALESRLQFAFSLHQKPDQKNLFEAGLNLQILFYGFKEKYVNKTNEMVPLISVNGTSTLLKGYFEWQREFTDRFTFNAGLTGLYFGFNNKVTADPRISFKWQVTALHSISFGTGLYSQLPEAMFYFVRTTMPDSSEVLTNKGLGYMKSYHIVLGYDYLITPKLRLKAEVYYQHLFNIPVRQNEPAYSMVNFGDDSFSSIPIIDSLINKGTGNNYGLEITVEKFMSKGLYFLFTGSLFSSTYRGYDGILRHTAFDKNFVMNLLAGKEFCIRKKNFLTLDLKLTWAGGMRYLPFHAVQVEEGYYVRVNEWDEAYETRRPDYFRLDFRVGYKINFRKMTGEIAVDMLNLTDQKDIYYQFLEPSTGQIKTVYMLPFLPVPLIRFQF